MTTGKARVLVVSPAGRVYGHDKVEWEARSQLWIEANYFNIGDMVVYDSTLKMLDFANVEGVEITTPSEENIQHYKGFDFFMVRASNFVNNEMVWHRALEVFDRVQLPIYAIGVGGQAVDHNSYELRGTNLRFWQVVSERSKVIGVRGAFTAELLARNGIKNVEIVGCPSIFRSRNRHLQIEVPERIESVAFSIRREVGAGYAADERFYLQAQRDLLLKTARQFKTTLTIHGEPEEKAFYYRNNKTMAAARQTFLRSGWWSPETERELEELYRNHIFFFLKVEDYDDFIKSNDFAIGYRVHGILPALANGVPGVLVRYDVRSAELADTHAIPSLTIDQDAKVDVYDLIHNVSFDRFNRTYPIAYDKMVSVLNANGLSHRL